MVAFSKICIAGSGVIGNSIAYYLSKRNIPCTLIDPVGIAPAASGKAGGFLAKDWSDGTPLGPLQRRSFDLHATLAEELGGAHVTDYRRLTCAAVAVGGGLVGKPGGKKLEGVEWADLNVLGSREMGGEGTIAQVHPKKLCRALFDKAQERVGTRLVVGSVVRVVLDDDDGVKGVELENGEVIEADALIVACGPWTDSARGWFGSKVSLPRMLGVKYHSILVASDRVLSQAVFFQGAGDPEVYPRPDGDAYITGFPDDAVIVEEHPGEEEVRKDAVDRLTEAMTAVSTELGGRTPHTSQSCYLPTTRSGSPIIGNIPGVKGGFIASGHGCWGILNGPATGEAMAELLVDGKTTHVNIEQFDPQRVIF
eukprot:CAMPEP_0172507666 /NCGR_PEP_ID=MMETSP1066-20121228/205453_1 /TAXON_ID=671091 /ORGANISM="Coscinodiscus wailesii, Strain CCMP2513" /LENGTH=366 /DNA_ID=CAMNT_0013285293 /DNA_START=1 /DNA_END=1101 /DNA_ORIENTATION=-